MRKTIRYNCDYATAQMHYVPFAHNFESQGSTVLYIFELAPKGFLGELRTGARYDSNVRRRKNISNSSQNADSFDSHRVSAKIDGTLLRLRLGRPNKTMSHSLLGSYDAR